MKTINIVKKEFEQSLIQLVEECNIPACILKDIFEKYLRQLQNIAEADYKRDLEQLQRSEPQKKENEELS